jgi:hypothetical protein
MEGVERAPHRLLLHRSLFVAPSGALRHLIERLTLQENAMPESAEKEARKALVRLRRAVEKSRKEMDSLAGAIRHAEGEDFPEGAYAEAGELVTQLLDFVGEEGRRLEAKILLAGGLEPGRVRRSSE